MPAREQQDPLIPPPERSNAVRMMIVGIGGAGLSSVGRMVSAWSESPPVLVLDTDARALEACPVSRTMQIGVKACSGLGTGGDVTAGRLAAEESIEQVLSDLQGLDVLILVTGLGGGTGTGAAPVIAREARRNGILTIVFATMPFTFEGGVRSRQAADGFRTLQQEADAAIAMPNQRLLQLVDPEKTGFEQAFAHSDVMLGEGLIGLWRMMTKKSVVHVSLADLRKVAASSGGCCAYAHAEADGPTRKTDVLQRLMDSPMMERGRVLTDAAGMIVLLTAGNDLTMADFQGIMGCLSEKLRKDVNLFSGAIIDPSYRERVAITVIASENWAATERTVVDRPPAARPESGLQQVDLDLKVEPRGVFSGVEPTFVGGEDLDTPTFVRRGIRLTVAY